jgi:hypothetical protein
MIDRQIATSLITRNGKNTNKIEYKQIFNFMYRDSAAILTIGGIIFDENQRSIVDKMAFENLSFFKDGNDSYKIQCPNLTLREIKALDKILPDKLERKGIGFENAKINEIPLIQTDIENYAKVYRYFPNFTEVNL